MIIATNETLQEFITNHGEKRMSKIIIENDTEHGRFEVKLNRLLGPPVTPYAVSYTVHVTYKENLQRAVDFAKGYRMHTEGLENAEIVIK